MEIHPALHLQNWWRSDLSRRQSGWTTNVSSCFRLHFIVVVMVIMQVQELSHIQDVLRTYQCFHADSIMEQSTWSTNQSTELTRFLFIASHGPTYILDHPSIDMGVVGLLSWKFVDHKVPQESTWKPSIVGTTVDGRNPANQLRLVVYLVIYRVLYISGGAGFLPSTVVLKHQPMFLFVLPLRSIPMLQAYHVRSTCSLCHQACRWVFYCCNPGSCLRNIYTQPIFPFHTQVLNNDTWIDPKRPNWMCCVWLQYPYFWRSLHVGVVYLNCASRSPMLRSVSGRCFVSFQTPWASFLINGVT